MAVDESRVLSVSQLNDYVKMVIDNNPILTNVWVRGEISNFTHHSTGHLYFSLKDEKSRLMAVMFRSDAQKLAFSLENGMKVLLHGRVSVFQRDGVYQIYVTSVEPDGVGALYIAYEQLKRRLEAEGMFDSTIKKPLPKIPSVVGVITSSTGAAVRDIINVTGRRFPFAKIVLYPSLVQGDGAENDLISGVRYFSENYAADVVIIGRGGGSIEDLWAFNSEKLAREIRKSKVPVISAVGHETDFTICDFVADRRAPTPSAAAEIAVPDSDELKRKFDNVVIRMRDILLSSVKQYRADLKSVSMSRVLTDPRVYLDDRRLAVLSLSRDLERAVKDSLSDKKSEFTRLSSVLEAVSPLKVISKGYSAVFSGDGKVIRSISDVNENEKISMQVSDGIINASVISVIPKNENERGI